MSLIENMYDDFILMEKRRTPDGEGGFVVEWEEGITIRGAMTRNTTMEAQIAEAQGVKSVYTFTTNKGTELDYQDVLKNAQNGRYYRITSEKGEIVSPMISSLDIAQYSAEKWELT